MSKLALVLSGGGMSGAAHLGAIKALEHYNLKPEAVLGTSIGAFVGSVYASGASPEMLITGWQEISQMDPSEVLDLDLKSLGQAVAGFRHNHVTGFLLGRVLGRMLENNYVHIQSFRELSQLSPAERQAKNVKEFYACATNLMDGLETVFCDTHGLPIDSQGLYKGRRLCHCPSFIDAVRASFSLPAVFVPHKIPFPHGDCPCKQGVFPDAPPYHLYIDGSIKDDYPITIAAKIAQADKIIGINLTKAGNKIDNILRGGLPEIQSRVAQIIGDDQYEADRDDKDVSRADLITIDPAIGNIGLFDMSQGDWLIERGYEAVVQCFEAHGLEPGLSREENLGRLFPPHMIQDCRECGQALPEALDIGTHAHFIAHLPFQATQNEDEDAEVRSVLVQKLSHLQRWRWGLVFGGLVLLFCLGGFQYWWVYRLASGGDQAGFVFLGGGLVYSLSVLLASAFIGSWLTLLLKTWLKTRQRL